MIKQPRSETGTFASYYKGNMKKISIRLPEELLEKIDEKGDDRSKVIRELLEKNLLKE
jgi:metal-responsive CopG/Arc/MetJ family transcriptional regulator